MPVNLKYDDDFFRGLMRRLEKTERELQRLQNSIITKAAPFRLADNSPVQGQTAIDPADDKFKWYSSGAWHSGGSGGSPFIPIYVGTHGVDGVDALLAANPHPFATGDSPGPVPFQNSWTNSLGIYAPVSFGIDSNGFVFTDGAYYGGADGTVVFTLPVGYRPLYAEVENEADPTGATISTVIYRTNGEVYFVTAAAL